MSLIPKNAALSLTKDDFEQVVYCNDPKVGLKAIIAIHSTVLGPGTGGCRIWNYTSEEDALSDVLRLSRGMTYKAAISGLNWGGGKAVIIGDPRVPKNPALLERFGEFVERLGGHYITAKDVGIGAEDLKVIKRKTRHILGIEGENGSSGDPSPATAWGVYFGMKACAKHVLKTDSLKGLRIVVQGLGSVAYSLLEHLVGEGAEVIGCDIDERTIKRAVDRYSIEIVSPDRVYSLPCDVFAPCALGAGINRQTISQLRTRVIAGAANNQLASDEDGYELMRRGISYAPDYAINAGGLINIYHESSSQTGYHRERAFSHVAQIEKTIASILKRADEERVPTHRIADRMAEERVERGKEGNAQIQGC